ncbi:hypothetical protein MA16_Dca016759 [Dendrobium catenatum]|uniref:Uncharacterized protein n=1 Tax=Dendrobium catenatum TaxID=906689 RepID=A0A2I0V9C8_9ASPA|nr:hypothetical protein MA16_Dca016759 [Dendrobium catenatum]
MNKDHDLIPSSANIVTKVINHNIHFTSPAVHANSVEISTEAGVVPNSEKNKINMTLEQCPWIDNIVPITTLAGASSNIPNLNSPSSLTSSTSASMFRSDGQKDYRVNSANKFSVLQDDNEDDSSSSLHNEGMEDSKGYSAKNKKENIGISNTKVLNSNEPSSQRSTRGNGNRKSPNKKS